MSMDNMTEKVHRKVYTYNSHLSAAEYYLGAERKGNQIVDYNAIGAITFSAFALEAFLNHIGAQLFECWPSHLKKSLSTEAKLTLICEKLSISVNFGIEPFQSFRTAFRFRNAMAHSATESLDPEQAKYYLEVGSSSWPASEWEKICNLDIAQNLLNQTKCLIELIDSKSGLENIPRFLLSEFVEV